MKKLIIKSIWLPLVLVLGLNTASPAQPIAPAPIPSGEQIIIWMRASQAAQDADLRAILLENNAVSKYLELLNLDLAQVDLLTLFMPFDKTWFVGARMVSLPQTLPKNGAFIISGKFDSKTKFQGLKSKGWKELGYSNKKVLWWSTGASFYQNPKSEECIGQLPGGGLLVAGSEQSIKNVLDVAGGKTLGLQANGTYEYIFQAFAANNSRLASAFILVTTEMRDIAKSDTAAIRSEIARAALSYVDHLDAIGLSMANAGNGIVLNGYLGMDSESNALIVTSIFQIGGGLAALLPPNNPNRNILENMDVSRQGKLVMLQSNISRQQFISSMRPRK